MLIEGSGEALHLESKLQNLPLHSFAIALDSPGSHLATVFEQHPLLPGALLIDGERIMGVLSRQRFLEYLIRPHGIDLFLNQPLRVLHSYARREWLMLPGETPILVAAQQSLRRSPDLLGEPVVVQLHQSYGLLDVHELNIAHWQIRGIETQVRYERTQAQMIQSDKMANLGRLVDGVAHEILDPVSFIWGNLSHISSYIQALLDLVTAYDRAIPVPSTELAQLRSDLELDYLQQDLPRAITSVQAGAERLSKLATSLQNFCHIDAVYPKPTDLHELIDGILLLLKSRLKSEVQVIKHYGHLPPVPCYPGQLNQVFMNILSRSLDTLLNQAVSQQLDLELKANRNQEEKALQMPKPAISITTCVCSLDTHPDSNLRWVAIYITDNGPGLSAQTQQQLQESFSVKRRAEKETSLAVSYQIVTAKHGGQFRVRSRGVALGDLAQNPLLPSTSQLEGQTGTVFEIWLPLA
jgi:signal transduction histidine kinase